MNFLPPEYDTKEIFKYVPDMWMNEIKYIEKLLINLSTKNGKIKILEWGAGNSSIYFSLFMNAMNIQYEWHSIENYIPWYNNVIEFIKKNNLQKNTFCHLKSGTNEKNKQKQEKMRLDDYLNYPTFMDIGFDLILIDGRLRDECLTIASKILKQSGYVVLHDAERKQYHKGFKYYIDKGEFIIKNISLNSQDGVQKMWIGAIK
jgi:hypothetical protein